MESIRPIRALMRGLDALTVLNLRDGATVSDIVDEIRLPRTTVYRILETLRHASFVRRSRDDRYHLTARVRGLSGGFDDEAWVTRSARPMLHALSRDIVWPAAISTLGATPPLSATATRPTMTVRVATDHTSPLAIDRYSAGHRVALLSTATGLAYLAHCSAAQQDSLLERLSGSPRLEDRPARSRDETRRLLEDVKRQGYATGTRLRRMTEENTVSVPVMLADRVLASITVRFAAAALPLHVGLQRFLPKLRGCAAEIAAQSSNNRPGQ